MKALTALAAALSACCCLNAQTAVQDGGAPPAQSLAAIIPKTTFKATLMKLAFDKSAHEISQRFNAALASSPEWFQAYMTENAGVKPLPYHRNFGISEEEYKTMLKSFESRRLEPVQEVTVLVGRAQDGSYRLDCPELGKAFSGIVMDMKGGRLSTPLLNIEKPDAKSSGTAADGNPFGDWKGASWKKSESAPEKGSFKSVALFAGRSSTLSRCFISYRIKSMEANKIKLNYESVLQFESSQPAPLDGDGAEPPR